MPRSKLEKQKEAEERSALRAKMGHKEQIAALDARFGKGLGAAKERSRLKGLADSPKTSPDVSGKKPKKKKSEPE